MELKWNGGDWVAASGTGSRPTEVLQMKERRENTAVQTRPTEVRTMGAGMGGGGGVPQPCPLCFVDHKARGAPPLGLV